MADSLEHQKGHQLLCFELEIRLFVKSMKLIGPCYFCNCFLLDDSNCYVKPDLSGFHLILFCNHVRKSVPVYLFMNLVINVY